MHNQTPKGHDDNRSAMTDVGDGLAPGTRLQELHIERELGSGGFGITYLARDLALDRWVAVKEYLPRDWGTRRADGTVCPRSTTSSEDYAWGLKRFLKEARILAKLDNRGIVRVHRIVETGGTAYIVMEHIDGHSLQEELKLQGPLPEARVRQLLGGLASGLAVVHGAGLLHRDVKPANVMLRKEDGSPVLIDFGAARQQMGRQSRSLMAVLTPGYAPPEQYYTTGRQGAWTDIYALGAVAYEALSGRLPDEAPGRALADELAPVEEVAAHPVSGELAGAVMAALGTDPARRPQSVAEWMGMLGQGPPAEPRAKRAGSASVSQGLDAPDALAATTYGDSMDVSVPAGAGNGVTGSGRAGPARRSLWPIWAAAGTLALVAGLLLWPRGEEAAENPEVGPQAVEEALALSLSNRDLVQRGLAEAGHDPGERGGFMGGGTRDALQKWQEEKGVAATGYLTMDAAEFLQNLGREAVRSDSLKAAEDETRSRATGAAQAAAARAAAAAERTRPGRSFRDCATCPEMVVLPTGSFQMGEQGGFMEGPVHTVTIAYVVAVGKYEVTFDEWNACSSAGGCGGYVPEDHGFGQGRRPAINVSWEDAKAYVSWLSQTTGEAYRLPSEAEWEYAARGGTETSRYWGDGSTEQCMHANGADVAWRSSLPDLSAYPTLDEKPVACDDGNAKTAEVGSYPPNAWGLHDMLGNVAEWTEDCWNLSYDGAPTDGSVWADGDCLVARPQRGGSFDASSYELRSASRWGPPYQLRQEGFGFRVARTIR